jgi:glutamyl-tRNA reductase
VSPKRSPLARLAIVGTSWRDAGVESLTRFTLPIECRNERLPALARALGSAELVYVATCNRVEVVIALGEHGDPAVLRRQVFSELAGLEARPDEVERTLRVWTGMAAVEHLFEVAAGLDSAQVGEREIQGQLRTAVAGARELGLCSAMLEEMFTAALRTARRAHRETHVGAGRLSLAEIGLDYVRQRLRRAPGAVALIGVSTMTRRCARALATAGVPVLVVNRTLDKAEQLAAEIGARACPLEDFRARPEPVEAVITATSATQPVLDRSDLERLGACAPSGEPPLLVDMAVPHDVDPGIARALGLARVGMAEITAVAETQRERRLHEAAPARAVIRAGVEQLRRRIGLRELAPELSRLEHRQRALASNSLDRLLAGELAGLGAAERDALHRTVFALARRLSRVQAAGLRALAEEHGTAAVRTFLAVVHGPPMDDCVEAAGPCPGRALPNRRTSSAAHPTGDENKAFFGTAGERPVGTQPSTTTATEALEEDGPECATRPELRLVGGSED